LKSINDNQEIKMHGGRRPKAGRPKGSRDKGKAAIAALTALGGETPIALWTSVLTNKEAPLELRLAVARDLAPYVHPKLSSTEAKVAIATHDDFWAGLAAQAPSA
jgi:hypothetical protein